jgi:hypothetical protein
MPFELEVVTTAQWGARAPRNFPFAKTQPLYVVVHHVVSGNPPDDASHGTLEGAKRLARDIQRDHMDRRDFSDTGQNFTNSTGGFVLEGRHGTVDALDHGHCIQSAHAARGGNRLANGNGSPGIENEGNFMAFDMVPKQWDSLVALCAALVKACGLKPEHIQGHREFDNTQCPGNRLYDALPKLRKDVAAALDDAIPAGRAENRWPMSVVVRHGDRGPTVLLLQQALKKAGFSPAAPDGLFGDATRAAVVAFQNARGLTANGHFDRATREALGV